MVEVDLCICVHNNDMFLTVCYRESIHLDLDLMNVVSDKHVANVIILLRCMVLSMCQKSPHSLTEISGNKRSALKIDYPRKVSVIRRESGGGCREVSDPTCWSQPSEYGRLVGIVFTVACMSTVTPYSCFYPWILSHTFFIRYNPFSDHTTRTLFFFVLCI